MVDDDDFEWLSERKWYANAVRKKGRIIAYYAMHDHTLMHREIMRRAGFNCPQYDHKDGFTLNNQKENLRPATQGQQNANRKKWKVRSSNFKGVSWWPRNKRWVAQVRKDGKRVYFGMFKDEEEAARAYDKALREQFGWFSLTNFL